MHLTFLVALSVLRVPLSVAQQYELDASFFGVTFFDSFYLYDSLDPSYGFVHYVDESTAVANGMLSFTDTTATWGVDSQITYDPDANLGRMSIRILSKQSWTHGLFVLDLAHMPSNGCGVWPAFWTFGGPQPWPVDGEIDIIEWTNDADTNQMGLHTTENCTIAGFDQTGTLLTNDCGAGSGCTGCEVSSSTPNNMGDDFNTNGGGVYVMEWTSTSIQIWFFPRNAIPQSIDSITSPHPDVGAFGVPMANFQGSCDIDAHFYNHTIVFDIDFCGSWAGNTWEEQGCPMINATNGWQSCNNFVALQPQAFVDTYWEVTFLNVYTTAAGVSVTSSSVTSSSIPAISTSSVATALSGGEGRSTTPAASLATTEPLMTTGFMDTSSALSVLSSIESESAASGASTSSTVSLATSSISSVSSMFSTEVASSLSSALMPTQPLPSTLAPNSPAVSVSSPLSKSPSSAATPHPTSSSINPSPMPSVSTPVPCSLSFSMPLVSSKTAEQSFQSLSDPPVVTICGTDFSCTVYATIVITVTVTEGGIVQRGTKEDGMLAYATWTPSETSRLLGALRPTSKQSVAGW